jgi:hypothetical protein
MATIQYPTPAASLPDAEFHWVDVNGNTIDLSSGWTFKMTIGQPPTPAKITKTTGFTATSGNPNLSVAWDPQELSVLTPGTWYIQLTATNATGHQRIMTGTLRIDASIIQ